MLSLDYTLKPRCFGLALRKPSSKAIKSRQRPRLSKKMIPPADEGKVGLEALTNLWEPRRSQRIDDEEFYLPLLRDGRSEPVAHLVGMLENRYDHCE